MQALSTNFRNMLNHRIKDFVTTMMPFSHVQMTKREERGLPSRTASGHQALRRKQNSAIRVHVVKVLNMVNDLIVKYSRAFTNSPLSTTACSFIPTDSPYIHSNFNLATKAIKVLPNCKITSRKRPVNKRLIKYLYKTPYCYCKR